MRTLELAKRPGTWTGKAAVADVDQHVRVPSRLVEDGKTVGAYIHLDPGSVDPIRRLVPANVGLAAGRILPPPGITDMRIWKPDDLEAAGHLDAVAGVGELVEACFHDYLPEQVLAIEKLVGDGRPFTTLSVKPNNLAPYHTDAGYFANSFTSLLVLREGKSAGGFTLLPEYGLALDMQDASLLLFHGARIIHGVSTLTAHSEGASRTAVLLWPGEYTYQAPAQPSRW